MDIQVCLCSMHFLYKSVAPLPSRWFDQFLKQSRPKLRTCNMSQVDPEGSGWSKKNIYIAAFFLGIFVFFFFFFSSFKVYIQPSSPSLSLPVVSDLPKNEQKHWQFTLATFSLFTHSHKRTSLTPSTNVRWTCDQVIITSPHCPGCLQVCINTLRHHLHCGCEYWCCSKRKKTGPLGEMKSRGSWKHPPLWPFFHMYWLNHPCAKGLKKYAL